MNKDVTSVMLCLDRTNDVIEEAYKNEVENIDRSIFKTIEKNGYIEIIEMQIERNPFVHKKGDILVPGDVVSTGFKSEAVLSIGESTVTVRALTRLTIEQLYEKNKNNISR